MAMFANYLRTALRSIRRHRVHTFLNVIGLSIGMACTIVIVQWVRFEFSFDRYHANADRIYRLATNFNLGTLQGKAAITDHPSGPTLQRYFAEIEKAVRFRDVWGTSVLQYGDRTFSENRLLFADAAVFEVFSFPLIQGDSRTALAEPYSVVLTKAAALKIFGTIDIVGNQIRISNPRYAALRRGPLVTVTAVMENVPPNSQFTFSMLLSFETYYQDNQDRRDIWISDMDNYTYFLLAPGCDVEALVKKIPDVVRNHLDPTILEAGGGYDLFLQPLTRIHLHSNLIGDLEQGDHFNKVMVLLVIAVLILVIACINFINLTSARSAGRGREVGIRKTLGADRRALIWQFMGEAILLSILALLFALGWVELIRPFLRHMDQLQAHFASIYRPATLAGYVLLAVVVGAVAGAYPAVFLSAAQPRSFLNRRSVIRAGKFRNLLVILQFSVSICMIVATIVIFRQLDLMQHKALGFEPDRVLVAPILNSEVHETYQSVRRRLMEYEGVADVAFTSHQPGRHARINVLVPEGYRNRDMQRMDVVSIDENYVPALGIKLAAGHNFSSGRPADNRRAVLINRTAARKFGWTNAVGKTIGEFDKDPAPKTVIGVTEDFHQRNLYNRIAPLYLEYDPGRFNFALVKLKPGAGESAKAVVEAKWKEINRSSVVASWFLDDGYLEHYRALNQMGRLFTGFSLTALLIACLGLYGLTTFMVEARTREIGIRKSIGASGTDIFRLLSKTFVKWVLAANVIAWPVIYWFNESWLEDFPYRVNTNLGIIILAGLAALGGALVTVGWKVHKAAGANPVDALRYE